MRTFIVAAVTALALAACADREPEAKRPPATDRERDSVLAGSKLPGASGVGAATRLADSGAARRAREDSISRAP